MVAQSNLVVRSNDDSWTLHKANLVRLRERHDTQVRKHKGNERAMVNSEHLRNSLLPSDPNKPNPSRCSKLVAVFMRESRSAPTGVSRTHRWKMNVKLNLSDVFKNTSTRLDEETEVTFQEGGISKTNPIEFGKFVIVIKNHVSRVCFGTLIKGLD